MSYLADTHMHSIYSYDGQMRLEEMVKQGIKLGLQYMAFTEHLEFNQITLKQFFNRYQVYSKEIDELQQKYPNIKLLKAVEFSNPEEHLEELEKVNRLDLDYVIGSNHMMPETNQEIDILKYYQRILKMVEIGGIDAVGHLDYLRRRYQDIEPSHVLEQIFEQMVEKNITLEINSSAIRRTGLDSFPSFDKLKLYKDMGGQRVTIGSDAHRLHEIYDGIPQIDDQYQFEKGVYIKRKFVPLQYR